MAFIVKQQNIGGCFTKFRYIRCLNICKNITERCNKTCSHKDILYVWGYYALMRVGFIFVFLFRGKMD